jgi:hypothetical protein
MDLGTMKASAIPLILLATDAGYRMRCPHLPAHTDIQITLALADIRWDPSEPSNVPIKQEIADKNYIFRTKFDDFSAYWLGHSDGSDYTPRPTSDEWIKLDGEYTATQRTRTVSQKIEVGGALIRRR